MNRSAKSGADDHEQPAQKMSHQPPAADRCEPLRADLLCPGRLLQELTASYRPLAAQKGLEFKTAAYPDWHDVVVDASKVRQIVAILLDDAITRTSEGWVRLECQPPNGQHWGIVIEDAGRSANSGESTHHGEKRRQDAADPAPCVTGDRPASCEELVGRLGGTICFHRSPGGGTRVEVRLPVMVSRAF